MDTSKTPIYEVSHNVTFFECDFNGNWKPASFFQQLTELAAVHAGLLGFGYEEMLSQNLHWVHSRMKIKFLSFPHPGEQIVLRTWPKTIQQKLFYIRDFEVIDSGGNLLAAATSAWLVINSANHKLVPPQACSINLPGLPDRHGLDEPLEKIGLAGSLTESRRFTPAYSAIDMIGHVNNSRYVEWLSDSLPIDLFRTHTIDWIQVNYDHEVLPAEKVVVKTGTTPGQKNLWMAEGIKLDSGIRAFSAQVMFTENGKELIHI
jgi:acyl-ACP thioesterase